MFKTKRFGMFIHWGIYSVNKIHEQEMWRYGTSKEAYEEYARSFNPKNYNPHDWVKLAKDSGFDYITFTTKHHDGFCMWDTAYSDYKVTNTPYGKDVLKELADACHKEGIGLSLYYSVPDWHHNNYPNNIGHHEIERTDKDYAPNEALYIEYVKNQVKELVTNYGRIESFFWDIPPKTRDKSLNELIRSYQPHIYINNRGYDEGDFSTPERVSADGAVFEGLTEACDSVGAESWGYRESEDYHSMLYLTSAIDRYMAMGANYVLNAGPDSDGRICGQARKILEDVGAWYKNVKEALFATPVRYEWASKKAMVTTKSQNTLYIHLPPNPPSSGFFIKEAKVLPKSATILNNGKELNITWDKIPSLFDGNAGNLKQVLHIFGIPVDALASETIIIKLEFEKLDGAFEESSQSSDKRIL